MSPFADIGLAYEFAIALVASIVLTFAAALLRLFWKKRMLSQNQMKQDLEAAEKLTQRAVMPEKILSEGDYFGVRAIERGFYGGVAQSAPTSTENSPRLTPLSTIIDRNWPLMPLNPSLGSSIPDLSLDGRSASRDTHNAKSLGTHVPTKTLRLLPSDAELNGRRNHDPAVAMSLHSPTSPISPLRLEASTGWKPSSEGLSRVSTPHNSRPVLQRQVQSYAQWRLAADIKSTARPVPRSENRTSGLSSQEDYFGPAYTHREAGRRVSHLVSIIDGGSHLQSPRQDLDAKNAAGSVDSPGEPSHSTCGDNVESIQQPSRCHTRPQNTDFTNIEVDKSSSSHNQQRGHHKGESSSSSSTSTSSTRSRSSSGGTSVSSIESITISTEKTLEPGLENGCNRGRKTSRSEQTVTQPIATLLVAR